MQRRLHYKLAHQTNSKASSRCQTLPARLLSRTHILYLLRLWWGLGQVRRSPTKASLSKQCLFGPVSLSLFTRGRRFPRPGIEQLAECQSGDGKSNLPDILVDQSHKLWWRPSLAHRLARDDPKMFGSQGEREGLCPGWGRSRNDDKHISQQLSPNCELRLA